VGTEELERMSWALPKATRISSIKAVKESEMPERMGLSSLLSVTLVRRRTVWILRWRVSPRLEV